MSKKLAHAMYGEPVNNIRPAASTSGSAPAGAGLPYLGRNRCIANNDTCEGPKARDTDYCIGHLRSMAKKEEQ